MSRPTATQLVVDLGETFFGPDWVIPLARFTGTNERTIRRIKAAAEVGEDYPAARGVLAALYEVANDLVEATRKWARE